ncbi:MAG: flagellar basal body-associated FliL family protein [Clostridium sp.]
MASDNKKEQEKKGKGKFILISILALAIVGAGTFFATKIMLEKKAAAAGAEPIIKEAYFDLGEVMVNLNDEGVKRYLKTTMSISYDSSNKKLPAELEEKKVALRDATIYYFKTKKTSDFNSENEAAVKKGLVDKINGILIEGKILDVKFADLITQ